MTTVRNYETGKKTQIHGSDRRVQKVVAWIRSVRGFHGHSIYILGRRHGK